LAGTKKRETRIRRGGIEGSVLRTILVQRTGRKKLGSSVLSKVGVPDRVDWPKALRHGEQKAGSIEHNPGGNKQVRQKN